MPSTGTDLELLGARGVLPMVVRPPDLRADFGRLKLGGSDGHCFAGPPVALPRQSLSSVKPKVLL